MILNFPQRDCLRTRKVSRLHCLQSYWRSFPIFMFSHCNKLSIKTLNTLYSQQKCHIDTKFLWFLWFMHFCRKMLSWWFTHFFRRFFLTEKQTFILLECMVYSIWSYIHEFLQMSLSEKSRRECKYSVFKCGQNNIPKILISEYSHFI